MSKRLFLFAGYDKDGIIDDALVHYMKSLSGLGDIIFVGDSDFSNKELTKIKPHTIYAVGKRHGEYDFGSYKRAYNYAKKNKLLQKYDYIYMVNDSVYGPLFNLRDTLEKLEAFDTPAFGIIQSLHRIYAPIESWFIGITSKIAQSDWFDKFINSVTHQPSKFDITILYENGFTDLLIEHHIDYKCLFTVHGRATYNKIKKLFILGNPFIKKSAFIRHNGALGRQILYVLRHTESAPIIIHSAQRVYGKKYIDWLLTPNPLKIVFRNIKYLLHKVIKQ